MKKFVNFLLVLVVLVFCANPLFATPSEAEVGETIQGIIAVNGATMMQAMMGMVDNKTVKFEADMEKGIYTLTYKNFPTAGIEEQLNSLGMLADEEKLSIPFDYMSGTIVIKGNMMAESGPENFTINVKLKGGKVKTLFMNVKDTGKKDPDVVIKANGKVYHNVEKIMNEVEKSHK